MAQTGRRCGTAKKLTRHSYSRQAERVTSSQNHSTELDCYCNDERTHEKVWSCCEIFTRLCVRTAVLTGTLGNCRCPAAIPTARGPRAFEKTSRFGAKMIIMG